MPYFPGPLRVYGEGVESLPAPPQALSGALLADPEAVAAMVRGYGASLGATDLPALASWWARRYCVAIVPPVLVAAVVLECTLPVALAEIEVSLGRDSRVDRIHIPARRPSVGADFGASLDALAQTNLAPVFAALGSLRVSPRVLWSHAAEFVQYVGDALRTHPAVDPARRAALTAWLRTNPRFPPAYHHPAAASGKRVRRVCCLNYRLPGEPYCGVCPLACATAARGGEAA